MTPSQGLGPGPTTFTFTFSDTKGVADLGVLNILINNTIDGRHGCYLAYSRPLNVLYLVDDAGDAGGPFAGTGAMHTSGSIQNSQCLVTWGNSAVTAGGNNLSLMLSIAFTTAFSGDRIFYLAARDLSGANNTDWQAMAAWVVQ